MDGLGNAASVANPTTKVIRKSRITKGQTKKTVYPFTTGYDAWGMVNC